MATKIFLTPVRHIPRPQRTPRHIERVGKRVANRKQHSRRIGQVAPPAPMRSLIPPLEGEIRCKKTLRFFAGSVFSGGLLAYDFLDKLSMNVSYGGGTSWASLASACRIIRVDVYDLSGGSDVTVSTTRWQWKSLQGCPIEQTCTGTPIKPGSLSSAPPAKSLASDWISHNTANGTFAVCTIPSGSVVDLTIEFLLLVVADVGTQYISGTGTFCEVACLPLDQSGSGVLKCISMTSTL
jgi:hypothetical protein